MKLARLTIVLGAAASIGCSSESTAPAQKFGPPALLLPASHAHILQNDPNSGCGDHPTRGRGFRVSFAWGPSGDYYYLQVNHNGVESWATVVTDTVWTWTACNAYVHDGNLTGWTWWVVGYDGTTGEPIGKSEVRSFDFLPCRLADGSACNAPATQ